MNVTEGASSADLTGNPDGYHEPIGFQPDASIVEGNGLSENGLSRRGRGLTTEIGANGLPVTCTPGGKPQQIGGLNVLDYEKSVLNDAMEQFAVDEAEQDSFIKTYKALSYVAWKTPGIREQILNSDDPIGVIGGLVIRLAKQVVQPKIEFQQAQVEISRLNAQQQNLDALSEMSSRAMKRGFLGLPGDGWAGVPQELRDAAKSMITDLAHTETAVYASRIPQEELERGVNNLNALATAEANRAVVMGSVQGRIEAERIATNTAKEVAGIEKKTASTVAGIQKAAAVEQANAGAYQAREMARVAVREKDSEVRSKETMATIEAISNALARPFNFVWRKVLDPQTGAVGAGVAIIEKVAQKIGEYKIEVIGGGAGAVLGTGIGYGIFEAAAHLEPVWWHYAAPAAVLGIVGWAIAYNEDNHDEPTLPQDQGSRPSGRSQFGSRPSMGMSGPTPSLSESLHAGAVAIDGHESGPTTMPSMHASRPTPSVEPAYHSINLTPKPSILSTPPSSKRKF